MNSTADNQYRQAHACLERAQAQRTDAACRFLEARARWKEAAAFGDGTEFPEREEDLRDPLDMAEAQLRQAKILYCAALEQDQLVRRILEQSREAYKQAQESLDRLVREISA